MRARMWNWFVRKLTPYINKEMGRRMGERMGQVVSDAEMSLFAELPLDRAGEDIRGIIVGTMLQRYADQHLIRALPDLVERFTEEFLENRPVQLLMDGGVLRVRMIDTNRARALAQVTTDSALEILNKRCKLIIATYRAEWQADMPERVVQRLAVDPHFRMGWTGWKTDMVRPGAAVEHKDVRDTIGSQFLACVIPYGDGPFLGGRIYIDRLGGQHFPELFGVCVPRPEQPPRAFAYEIGQDFGDAALIPATVFAGLVAASDDQLKDWLYRSWSALAALLDNRVAESQAELDSDNYKPIKVD